MLVTMSMAKKSAAPGRHILEAALQGQEAQRQKLDEQIAEVRALMGERSERSSKRTGGGATSGNSTGTTRKRRVLSAEARKRIAAAQKKRWAAFRKSQG